MLTPNEINKLRLLTYRIRERTASSQELEEFIKLIQKSGVSSQSDVVRMLNEAGFSSIEELSKHIQDKKSEELINTIVTVGLGILVGYALYKLISEE